MKSRFSEAFIGMFAVFALSFGVQAHAASLSSAQIQAVVGLLQSFNVDLATINYVTMSLGGTTVTPVPVPPPSLPGGCVQLSYNLSIGATDGRTQGQVSVLQRAFGLTATGYFGALTQQTVAHFQAQHNIPAVGVVGPITRQALLQTCTYPNPTPVPTPTPTPTPTTGTSFAFNTPFAVAVGQTATEAGLGQLNVLVVSVSNPTAQVTLGQNCARGTQCFYYPLQTFSMTVGQPVSFQGYTVTLNSVGTGGATFTATNGVVTASALFATPTAGNAPLTVTFSGTANAGCNGGTFELAYGDGQWDTVAIPADACTGTFSKAHTYTTAGNYTATLSQYISCLHSEPRCMIAQPSPIATAAIVVTGSSIQTAPVISSISPTQGPTGTQVTILGSGFTADNAVHFGVGGTQHVASSNNGTVIVYTIPNQVGPCDLTTSQQVCALYLQLITPGTYSLSVSNMNGQSGQASFMVTGAQNAGSLSIVSPVTGQNFNRGQDINVIWSANSSIPTSASITLDLYSENGTKVGTFAIASNSTNSYTWHIPGFPQNYMCTMQYPNGLCGTSIPTGRYYVKATASADGFNQNASIYASAQSGLFTITQPSVTTVSPSSVTASIVGMAFSPSALTVGNGSTVTWTNSDTVPHTVTSDTGAFGSQVLQPGQSYSFTFSTPGTYSYHCAVHPSMSGSVVVTQ